MIERHTGIKTGNGTMNTFICHPERDGPHPVVLFLMDAPGIREELRDMARRLATVGYYVALPNLYYRADNIEDLFTRKDPISRDAMFALMSELTIAKVMDDCDALLAFLAEEKATARGPIGAVGYCMSGQYAINVAARHPDRVAAAASIHGTRLITEEPDSPHLAARRAEAAFYIGCAEMDDYAPLDVVARFADSLREGQVDAEVEIYPGVGHGFVFPQRGAYDKTSAERHWERLFALYDRTLKRPA